MPDDPLDRLIDTALHHYAPAPHGLDGRVLTALASERGHATPRRWFSRPRIWIFSGALATSALLAAMYAIWPLHHGSEPQQVARTATPAPLIQQAPASPRRAPAANGTAPVIRSTASRTLVSAPARHARNIEHRPAPLPKKELFPSLQPLSPEMQALVQYAAHAPLKQREALVQAQARLDAPIAIAPLQIAPLNDSNTDEK